MSYLPCPKCDEPMRRTNFGPRSGIFLDVCRLHGTWLDALELEEIRAFVRAGGEVEPLPSSPGTSSPDPTSERDRTLRESEALLRYHLIGEERAAARTIGLLEHVLNLFANPWLRGRHRK